MNLVQLILLATSIVLAGACLYLSLLEERARAASKKLIRHLMLSQYELETVKSLSHESAYSLTITKIAQNMTATVEKLLAFSTISYALLEENSVFTETYVHDVVGKEYMDTIQQIIMNAISALDQNAQREYKSELKGELVIKDKSQPLSYFTIPLVVRGHFVGILTIASKKKDAYTEEEMKILYNIMNESVAEVEKMDEVIETEQSKLAATLISIPAGAIVFMIEKDNYRLSTINASAREFLHIEGDADTRKVVGSFGSAFGLPEQLKKVIQDKRDLVIENLDLYGKAYKIFLRPVFLYGTGKIVGVTITMQDMTIERQLQEIRDTFTNMVVHELRAPLTSIKGASELVLSGNLPQPDRDKMLHLIKSSTETMLNEIGELLDAAKIDAGKFVIQKSVGNISDVIKQRVDVFTAIAKQKDITLSADPTNIPEFEFDSMRVGQVLNNLFSNAIKFTHQGGAIWVSASIQGEFVRVMVSDNGIGIPAAKQPYMFAKYSQANQTQVKAAGTGLGLYISRSIVESHGGKIWLDSQEGHGTTFYFTLPLKGVVSSTKVQNNPILGASSMLN